jgi:hypothetical protein
MDQTTLFRLDVPGSDDMPRFFRMSGVIEGTWEMSMRHDGDFNPAHDPFGYTCYLIDFGTLAVSRNGKTWKAFACDPETGRYLDTPHEEHAPFATQRPAIHEAGEIPSDALDMDTAFTAVAGAEQRALVPPFRQDEAAATATEPELLAEVSANHRWLKVGGYVFAIDEIAGIGSHPENPDGSVILLKSNPNWQLSVECPVDLLYSALGQTGSIAPSFPARRV